MKLKELLESKEITFDVFNQQVETSFKNYFPNGFIRIKQTRGIGGNPLISIALGIGYASNGIEENDNMYHSILIHSAQGATDFSGSLEFSVLQSGINIKPPKDSYLAMERVKTKLTNKKSITLDKSIDKLMKWFPKLQKLMQDNQDNLYSGGNDDGTLKAELRV